MDKSIAAMFFNSHIIEKCTAMDVALTDELGVRAVLNNPFKIVITN